MQQALVYDFPLQVRYGEVGPDGQAMLSALGNWLQEAAGQSADSLGFGEQVLAELGITWILTRLMLRIHSLPAAGASVTVRTWPSHADHMAYRGYELYDASGALLVRGTSAWNVMERATRKLGGFPQALMDAYPPSAPACEPFSGRTLPRLQKPTCSAPILVRRDDLDLNGHVNNSRYLSWLLEGLPWSPGIPLIPSLIDVSFRSECFPGDALNTLCGLPASVEEHPLRLVHALRRDNGAQEDVCRAITCWQSRPTI